MPKKIVQSGPPGGEQEGNDRTESTPRLPALSRAVRKYFAAVGRLGGMAKVKKGFGSRTAAERRANAKAAAAARWGKKKKKGGGRNA